RRLGLTESGAAFYQRAVKLLAYLDEAEREASRAAAVPRGTIRITAAVTLGVRHLAPLIAEFLSRHRGVALDVSLSDRIVDLVEEGFDLGVRGGGAGAASLAARRLGETRLMVGASPDYLAAHGTPHVPADLEAHNCFTYEYVSPRDHWRFRDGSGREIAVRVKGSLHSNNGELHAEAAAGGVGIAFEPDMILLPYVRAGRVVPLLEAYLPAPMPVYAVYPSRKHLSAKVRVFVDFLVERLGEHWRSAV
ncbi:MAG: substrate binding domain-containing protein, partial [Betaproteobacteria bacterium]